MLTTVTPLDAEIRGYIVARIQKENNFSKELAEAVMDEALLYLHVIGNTNKPTKLGPSHIVDIGWHTFILYTVAYTEYCQKAFGRYIHHTPNMGDKVARPLKDTVDFFKANGITYDPELWGAKTTACDDAPCGQGFDDDQTGKATDCDGYCISDKVVSCTTEGDTPPAGDGDGCRAENLVNYGDTLKYAMATTACGGGVDCDGGGYGGGGACHGGCS